MLERKAVHLIDGSQSNLAAIGRLKDTVLNEAIKVFLEAFG